ncbi:molecular chaperone [Pseudomonas segetis]|uniref:molecular chaperone n=1 Tax=Pseudomonas segetis TaxID=298908 RepID=UPI000B784995|nr:molecular chaperone [Pseudomonas segetis]
MEYSGLTETQAPHLLLRVSTPKNQSLSFCDSTPRDLKRWIAHLPKANIGETARQLYQALVEINQLLTPSDNRLQLLELLRPEVHYVCQHLEKHFLNQAIVLDERPRKVANLCQALQNHLANGYKLVISRNVIKTTKESKQLLTIALQRAIHSLCGPLVRASQLYCPVPEGLWFELHQLYLIAKQRGLKNIVVRDPLARHSQGLSVEQNYIVAALIGCSRCNQMRQSSIARVAEALEQWSTLVNIEDGNDPESLFAIATQLDGPPRYTSLFQSKDLQIAIGIDTHPLVDALKEHLLLAPEAAGKSRLVVPEGLSIDLLQHLSAAWGDISERTFQRSTGQGSLNLCIGMSALHYFIANKRTFADILKLPVEVSKVEFKESTGRPDIWSNAFDAQKNPSWDHGLPLEEIEYEKPQAPAHASAPNEPARQDADSSQVFPTFELPIINLSPGGYCLTWPKDVPSQLQAGELLGIQDTPGQAWSVAVVRWIRQARGGGTQMGIELMAPHAQPCGLQLIRKSEQNSSYLRGLLLPEISAISRPASVLVPRLPFQEGNKVMVNIAGVEHRAVLGQKHASTGSFNQFEYRLSSLATEDPGKPVTPAGSQRAGSEEDFDSLWKSL